MKKGSGSIWFIFTGSLLLFFFYYSFRFAVYALKHCPHRQSNTLQIVRAYEGGKLHHEYLTREIRYLPRGWLHFIDQVDQSTVRMKGGLIVVEEAVTNNPAEYRGKPGTL